MKKDRMNYLLSISMIILIIILMMNLQFSFCSKEDKVIVNNNYVRSEGFKFNDTYIISNANLSGKNYIIIITKNMLFENCYFRDSEIMIVNNISSGIVFNSSNIYKSNLFFEYIGDFFSYQSIFKDCNISKECRVGDLIYV